MNEILLIRSQLALERAHAAAVANACATALQGVSGAEPTSDAPGLFRAACVDYLACVLAWFEERDQRLVELIQVRFRSSDPRRRAFEEVLARRGRSREALTRLESACATAVPDARACKQGWREFVEYFNGAWSPRRDALDALLSSNYRASDWRSFAGIDADSILEERRRYAQVRAQVPAGVILATQEDRA
jgi:hypothetical protein